MLQQFSTFQAQVKDREGVYVKNVVHKELLLSMRWEETVMHVKCHDQAQVMLWNLSLSLFFSAELHLILQSLYDNSLKLRLSSHRLTHTSLTSTKTSRGLKIAVAKI